MTELAGSELVSEFGPDYHALVLRCGPPEAALLELVRLPVPATLSNHLKFVDVHEHHVKLRDPTLKKLAMEKCLLQKSESKCHELNYSPLEAIPPTCRIPVSADESTRAELRTPLEISCLGNQKDEGQATNLAIIMHKMNMEITKK